MDYVALLGIVAAFMTAVIFLPQVIHTYKTKDTKGLSLPTYVLMNISNVLWATYGILTCDHAIILSQVFLIPMGLFILRYKLKYG